MGGSCVVGCAAGLGPQPVLFLSYMDGLPGGVRPQVCLFADDTAVCLSVNSPGDLAALRRDLDQLSSAECLGVSISTNLNFNNHINRITSSANKSLGFIKQIVRRKHHSVCETSYKTLSGLNLNMVLPYGVPTPNLIVTKLKLMVQRRAARWTLNRYSSYDSV